LSTTTTSHHHPHLLLALTPVSISDVKKFIPLGLLSVIGVRVVGILSMHTQTKLVRN
jgi:hypothetical protein